AKIALFSAAIVTMGSLAACQSTTCITVQAPRGLYFVTAKSRKKYLNYVSALSVNTFDEV
ncbi:hypothetical protein BXA18_19865, partial [Acinetobacter baumannii]